MQLDVVVVAVRETGEPVVPVAGTEAAQVRVQLDGKGLM